TLFFGGANRTSGSPGAGTGTRSQSWTACIVRPRKRKSPGHAAKIVPQPPGSCRTPGSAQEEGYLMRGRIKSLNAVRGEGVIQAENGDCISFEFSAVLAY